LPRALRSPESELNEFAARSTDAFARHFMRLTRALIAEDKRKYAVAMENLADAIAETMTVADLYGRRRLFLEFDAAADSSLDWVQWNRDLDAQP